MQKETLIEENMANVTAKTSSQLMQEIRVQIKKMMSDKLDETRFTIPNTSISYVLVRGGSNAEEIRKSDETSLTGMKYESGRDVFLLARR
jgi:hypothetical protein